MFFCPCIPIAFIGGWIGSKIGVPPPAHAKGKMISLGMTMGLTVITTIALKAFNISICGGRGLTLIGVTIAVVTTIPLGTVYNIGVNYILRFIFPKSPSSQQGTEDPSCCH